jgi:hypothetical protein
MIRFTVVWHEDAQNRLAQVWMDSRDRNAVTEATHIIDIHLASDPELKGTAVEGELRELVQPPLSVLFAVSEPDRLVKIVHVDTA